MAEWLALESEAEVERMAERRKRSQGKDAEKSGETILNLVVADQDPGLGGATLVTFVRRNREQPMPWHRLRVGSPVVVSAIPEEDSRSETGVVSRQHRDSIQVSLNRKPTGDAFRIDLTADEVTRQRQLAAIMTAKDSRGRLGQIRSIVMGQRDPEFGPESEFEFRTELNTSQQNAVRFCLSARDIAIIHGPPGTGKTTTVVELIIQAIARGDKVLACAPSNTAVDNLLERLVHANQKVVRIGHPARVSQQLRNYSLDGLVDQHENMPVIRDMIREAEEIFRKSDKWTRAKRQRGERQEMRRDAKRLLADSRMLERQAIQSVLDRARVICATNSFNEDLVSDRWFDLIVIDEACQSTEPGSRVPLIPGEKIVLAGDHQQLPPTVLSKPAAEAGFAISMMERQMELYGDEVSRLLDVQYRMNEQIMNFSSQQFYDEKLSAHESVQQHLLAGLEGVEENELTTNAIRFVDTAGAGWDEELEPERESKRNPNEAELVMKFVDRLEASGVLAQQIAVIAPYSAQVRLLRSICRERSSTLSGLKIDTVDGFQGREKEAVIISLVRSNDRNEIGFLADSRRMNVALTRARRKLIVIGDSATIGGHEFYQSFLSYVESLNAYHSVWDEM